MKRSFTLLSCGVLCWLAGPALLQAQDPYQPGCGNDSPTNHRCKSNSCPTGGEGDSNGDGGSDDDANDCDDAGANPINAEKANHHREVTDITTFGPAPISFARNVNSRTTDFNDPYWELGYKQVWQHNWNYETRQLTTKTYGFFDIKVRYPDGNDYNFKALDSSGAQLAPAADNGDRLYRWTGSTVGYTLVTSDGTEYDFWRYLSPKFHLTQLRNGLGYFWNCTYDSNQLLTKITNNFGRWVQINHQTGSDGVLRINQVSTSDGRTVTYDYSLWGSTGKYVLSTVNYPGGEQASYTYVTSDPSSGAARPLLSTASDPAYRHGKPGAQMKYVYNYNALAYGSVITGTLMEERSSVTNQTIVSFPLGSGSYPKILEGDGTEITRRYTNGLLSTKGDGEGRTTTYARDSGGFGFITSKTDANGAITQYSRDYAGRVLSRTDALGHARSHTYNSKGFMLTQTDELNRTTTITRDSTNRPTRKDYPDASYETWTYNANSQPLTHRLRNGGTESFAYDALGNVTSRMDAAGNTTTYTYYATGLASSARDARLNTIAYIYNWRGQVLTTTYSDNSTVSNQYDTFGNRTSVTDELGHATAYTYDEYNRVKTVTDPLNRTTSYEYGRAPGCNSCSYANTLTRITSPGGTQTTYSYDQSGLRTCQTVGAGTTDAATTTYSYDSAKSLVSMTDPRDKVSHFTYDDKHRKLSASDPLGNMTAWSYDSEGNKLTETRADGGVTHFVYDNRNRLSQTTDPAGHVTQMTYDNADNLLTLRDARNNLYAFAYDLLNRKLSLTYPDNSHENFGYDAVGNVATNTTRAGQVKTSTYDNRNRETGFVWNDSLTPSVTKTYDAAGRTVTMNSSISSLSYSYDGANQLLSETQNVSGGPAPKTVAYSYDANGNRLTLGYPGGNSVSYGYTGRNRLNGITSGSISANYVYDLNGNCLAKTLGNGTSASYAYDDANRLLSIDDRASGTSFERFNYAYNAAGNRTSRQSSIDNQSSTDIYGYDPIDQLTEVKYNFSAGANTQDRLVDYDYDSVGNRASVTDNGSSYTYSLNNLNEYTAISGNNLGYDTNGNLVSAAMPGATWTYTYDAQNRLTSALSTGTNMSASYDACNRCVSRIINGGITFFYYDGWNLIEERTGSDVLQASYTNGAHVDEIIARVTPVMASYYHHDVLGSTTALTDSNGSVTERYSYDVYGAPAFFDSTSQPLNSSTVGNRFLFTGREYLSVGGLYDYRNRIYSPSVGRFLQTDSLRFTAGDANLYRYVANSVTRVTDPHGLLGEQYTWFECTVTFELETSSTCCGGAVEGEGSAEDYDDAWNMSLDNVKAAVPAGCSVSQYHNPHCTKAQINLFKGWKPT
jgi:RHS repeat-associated protein